MVTIDVEHHDLAKRIELWEKLLSLKSILKEEYLPKAQFEDSFVLRNKKEVSRIYVEKKGVSIHNKNTWQETMEFLNEKMLKLEDFFKEYKDVMNG